MNPAPAFHPLPATAGNERIGAFMKFASRLGWEITSIDDIGIHLRKRKTYSRITSCSVR